MAYGNHAQNNLKLMNVYRCVQARVCRYIIYQFINQNYFEFKLN